MRATILSSEVDQSISSAYWLGEVVYIPIGGPNVKQRILAIDGQVEFDITMVSTNGCHIPVDSDVDVEIKFTVTPKAKQITTIFK